MEWWYYVAVGWEGEDNTRTVPIVLLYSSGKLAVRVKTEKGKYKNGGR